MAWTRQQWEDLATTALRQLLLGRSALVRPESEAILSETNWIQARKIAPMGDRRPQPHHITTAHHRLADAGELLDETVTLNNRNVTAWVDAEALRTRGPKTRVTEAAAAKRRLYRTHLGWTSDSALCGDAAELAVHAAIDNRAGRELLLPPDTRPGRVDQIAGQPITVGGPLDAAGYWLRDLTNPTREFIPFAVEVKNIRSWVYPWDHEAWELLAKIGTFPDVGPVLVARRIHPVTFRCFKYIGAIGHQTKTQWFVRPGTVPTQRHYLDRDELDRVAAELGFADATSWMIPRSHTPASFASSPRPPTNNLIPARPSLPAPLLGGQTPPHRRRTQGPARRAPHIHRATGDLDSLRRGHPTRRPLRHRRMDLHEVGVV